MTKEGFIKLIENAQNYNKELDKWHDFGIDLFELSISELGWNFFDTILQELFTDEGIEWINWWVYDRISITTGEPLKVYDKENKVIPTETIEDLWNLVKYSQK